MTHLWTVDLLGALRARSEERTITRFQTRQTGALLAYLAFYRERAHPREVLAEICWPDDEPEIARRKLRIALSSLRRQLEPPGVAPGSVLIATRTEVQLNPAASRTDVAEFEAALVAAAVTQSRLEQAQRLEQAAEWYRGALLAGFFEEWIVPERQRLEGVYLQALGQLISLLEKDGDLSRALHWARRAVDADPLHEEAHHELMRLLVAAGQPEAALRQYRELERLLEAELGTVPEGSSQRLVGSLKNGPLGSEGRPAPSRTVARSRPFLSAQPHPAPQSVSVPLPSRTMTLLMTEVEDTARLRARMGDRLADALDTHVALLRDAFRHRGGSELRVTGDSILYGFARAGDAITAAISGQQALAAYKWPIETGPLQVRVAVHTADVQLQGGQLHGPVLHHLTRLTLAAHGGQVLLSEASAGVLRSDLPPGVRLIEWGVFRLRTGSPPERLYQIESPDLPASPASRPNAARAYEGHLPLPLTRFFGREQEIARLIEMLVPNGADHAPSTGKEASATRSSFPTARHLRLATLTGTGGCGKTRLALETSAWLRERWQGEVWYVPLVELRDADRIPGAMIHALGLPPAVHLDPLEQMVEALGHQPALLVLDNMEQLLPGGEALVQTLLCRLPLLRVLVTSRRRLDLPGEQEIPVEPLPVPAAGEGGSSGKQDAAADLQAVEAVLQATSVRLFVDRAQSVRPEFQVTRGNAAAVAELCRRLEGIPLALELAAARINALTVRQILARLSQRLDMTSRRAVSAGGRHQSLRATLDWSFDLLSSDLRSFCARLSVFRGGWTPDAAEEVCEEPRALEYLVLLRQCSLVRTEETCGELRFGMLETVREYAAEQLAPEELAGAECRHARYYRALAEQAKPELTGPDQVTWFERLEAEHDNLRAAMVWARESGEADLGLHLGAALWWFWMVRGHWREGRAQLLRTLALPQAQAPSASRAKALNRAGSMAGHLGDNEQARLLLQESLAIRRSLGDRLGLTGPLNSLGNLAGGDADFPAAQTCFEECLSIYEEAGDEWGAAMSRANLARALHRQRRTREARPLVEESLRAMRDLGDTWHTAYALTILGQVSLAERDYQTAASRYREGLALFYGVESKSGSGECLEGLAVVADAEGRPERAARLFGAVRALVGEIGCRVPPPESSVYASSLVYELADAAERTRPAEWAEGHSWSLHEAIRYALDDDAS